MLGNKTKPRIYHSIQGQTRIKLALPYNQTHFAVSSVIMLGQIYNS